MTLPEILQFVSATCALASAGCAVAVARRSQRWRDTDEAQQLLKRIDSTESRLDILETQTRDLPTKADLASVKAELHAVCKQIDHDVVPGLKRIEAFFIEAGVKGR